MTNDESEGRRTIVICTTAVVVLAVLALTDWLRISDANLDHVVVVPEAMLCDGNPVTYRI